jgi:hypothetical protein
MVVAMPLLAVMAARVVAAVMQALQKVQELLGKVLTAAMLAVTLVALAAVQVKQGNLQLGQAV